MACPHRGRAPEARRPPGDPWSRIGDASTPADATLLSTIATLEDQERSLVFTRFDNDDAWLAMEKIYAAEGARAIGVSNFLQEHLDTLLAATTVVPAVNQIELHPTFQQTALAAKSRALGIAVEAYSPLGQGADLNAAAVTSLAQKRGATPAQVVLGWHLGIGNIVIPKSTHLNRMSENLAAAEITLDRDELDAITALDAGARIGTDPAEAAHTQM